ncbi:mCG1038335 [Mus musculus]|nr:mCG1038335 [Mus musculus]
MHLSSIHDYLPIHSSPELLIHVFTEESFPSLAQLELGPRCGLILFGGRHPGWWILVDSISQHVGIFVGLGTLGASDLPWLDKRLVSLSQIEFGLIM